MAIQSRGRRSPASAMIWSTIAIGDANASVNAPPRLCSASVAPPT